MAGFENVIVRALEKHHPTTPEVREQIYNSSRKALAGLLARTENLDDGAAQEQLQRLEEAIVAIEQQYLLPQQHEDLQPPDYSAAPQNFDIGEPQPMYHAGEGEATGRHPFARVLLMSIAVAALAMAGWWIYSQELLKSPSSRDNSVPNPEKVLTEEQSTASAAKANDWITVFDPADVRGLIAIGGATAELGKDTSGPYARLKVAGDGDAAIAVEPGVLEAIRGKKATFDITVKSADGQDQQFVVTCKFKTMGNCGRKRFTATQLVESFIFELVIADKAPQIEDRSATLSLTTDVTGNGRSLDVYSVRVITR